MAKASGQHLVSRLQSTLPYGAIDRGRWRQDRRLLRANTLIGLVAEDRSVHSPLPLFALRLLARNSSFALQSR
jgi:hypothetical protein